MALLSSLSPVLPKTLPSLLTSGWGGNEETHTLSLKHVFEAQPSLQIWITPKSSQCPKFSEEAG